MAYILIRFAFGTRLFVHVGFVVFPAFCLMDAAVDVVGSFAAVTLGYPGAVVLGRLLFSPSCLSFL